MILVDTNILVDISSGHPVWAERSAEALLRAAARDQLAINAVIFAEFSIGFQSVEACEAELARLEIAMAEMPNAALFRAGRAFVAYRRKGGTRTGTLPDFFIGAHAEQSSCPLLTRDAGRYATYFPEVTILTA